MNLKQLLKYIKLHESQLSVVAGILILIIAGIFVFRYINNLRNDVTNQEVTETQDENQVTHTIEKGESLWTISEKYYQKGSDWQRIADANNISDPSKIEVGQTISIPSVDIAEAATPAPEATPATPVSPIPQITDVAASTTNEITEDSYTVVKGDSLWKIALRAYGDGNKWVDIAKANNLKNPNIIHRGNNFSIPR